MSLISAGATANRGVTEECAGTDPILDSFQLNANFWAYFDYGESEAFQHLFNWDETVSWDRIIEFGVFT